VRIVRWSGRLLFCGVGAGPCSGVSPAAQELENRPRAGFPAKLGPLGIIVSRPQRDGAGKSRQRECNSGEFHALSTGHPPFSGSARGEGCARGLGAVKPSSPPTGPDLVHFRIADASILLLFLFLDVFLCLIPTIAHRPSSASPPAPFLSSNLRLCCSCKVRTQGCVRDLSKHGLLSSAMGSQAAVWYVASSMS
jgi:hypothetical protein